jgi:hypothetical protein
MEAIYPQNLWINLCATLRRTARKHAISAFSSLWIENDHYITGYKINELRVSNATRPAMGRVIG